ncbi:TolC family protein [Petrimonas sp.]|uniref:TolC family protein n=1 Tax=Petrimonas sp. TaxID=2023866 RepID=UPI003F51802B
MKSKGITLFLSMFLACAFSIKAQTLSIEDCQRMARENYPAIARYNVIENVKNFNLENANTAYFPQLSLNAKATWQSDVTKIDLELPQNFPPLAIPVPDKDQYQVSAQLNQLIWDGGKVAAQKENIAANAEVEKQKLETEIYSLQERVNNVFFGALLLKEQLQQQATLEKELQRNYEKVQSYVTNGVANDADLSAVKVEQLKAGQQRIQMESGLDSYLRILSVLIGQQVDNETVLEKPAVDLLLSNSINRPEIKLFEAQENLLNSQKSALNARNMPVIGAFAQGGYGKPALNMFENKFNPYFIGGVSLSWNFGSLYTFKNEKKSIEQQKIAIDSQRETFLHNLNMQLPQQQNEIEKYRRTMLDDNEIISLRTQIKNAAEAKVENGTMTVSDLLQEINALEIARQARSLHEIQYLMSIYTLKNITN